MPPQTKIAEKLQAMTTFVPAAEHASEELKIEELMQITHEHEVPPSKLPFNLKSDRFPSERPMSQEERQWLYFAIEKGVKGSNDPFSQLDFLQVGIFEVYRHLINADKIPSNAQFNPFTDLMNSMLLLSDLAGDICNQIIADNLEQYQKKLEVSERDDKVYLLNKQVEQLELELAAENEKLSDEVWKANEAEYNLSEVEKERDVKTSTVLKLNQKVEELQQHISEYELEIADLKTEQAAIELLVKGSLDLEESQQIADTHREITASCEMGEIMTNVGSLYNPASTSVVFSKTRDIVQSFNVDEETTEAEEPLMQMSKTGENGFIDHHLQTIELSRTMTKTVQDKVSLIRPHDAEIDFIPPIQTMRYDAGKSIQISPLIGYSRVEEAEIMLADGVPFNDIENNLDRAQQDNITEAVFLNTDILDYDTIHFNETTKEIEGLRKKLVPSGMNEENVVYASQRLVEGMTDITNDDAYALEQRALAKKSGNVVKPLEEYDTHTNSDEFSCIKLELQSHKAALESFLNPTLSGDLAIQQTELKMEAVSPYKQPKCVEKTNSCIKAILNASPAHGGIIGIFDANETGNKGDAFKTVLQGVCGEYQKSIFGCNFCSSQRNPFAIAPIEDDWAVCQTTAQDGEVIALNPNEESSPSGSIFSAFLIDYLKTHKEPPHIGNLVIWRIKRMGSKNSAFNISGLKLKPAPALVKLMQDTVFKKINNALSGQEYDKAMNERVFKRFSVQYKRFEAASAAKTPALLMSGLAGFSANDITEELFGIPVLSWCLHSAGLTLYPFEELVEQIDLILVNRQQIMDNIKNQGVFERIYVPFSTFIRQYFMEMMKYDEEEADARLISLAVSCTTYLAFLELLSAEKKKELLHYDDARRTVCFDNEVMSCSGALLEIFLQLLNEQISPENTEFLVFVYSGLRRRSLRTRIYNFTFISLEVAQATSAGLFPAMQTTGISGFLREVTVELMIALEHEAFVVGPEHLIDVGRVMEVCLRCKEALCTGFLTEAEREISSEASISLSDYVRILSQFVPEKSLCSEPLFDLVRALYTSFQTSTGVPRTLKNLIYNADWFISQNTFEFSLAIYDFYAERIPVLGLHKLFYSSKDNDTSSTGTAADQINAPESNLEQMMRQLSVVFAAHGLGLSPFLEPFSLSEAFPPSESEMGGIPQANTFTFIDEQRPGALNASHGMTLCYLTFAESNNSRTRSHLMEEMLVELITGISCLRCFETDLPSSHAMHNKYIAFGEGVIRAALELVEGNSYAEEMQAALGITLDETLEGDISLLLTLSKALIECAH